MFFWREKSNKKNTREFPVTDTTEKIIDKRETFPAYRNLYFGMYPDEVKEVMNQDKEIVLGEFSPNIKLLGQEFSLQFEYYKNQLHTIIFISDMFNDSNFYDGKDLYNALCELIETKYGVPTIRTNSFTKNNVNFSKWEGSKEISISYGKNTCHNAYMAIMRFEYVGLINQEELDKQQEIERFISSDIKDI